jgi:hypothetical protein
VDEAYQRFVRSRCQDGAAGGVGAPKYLHLKADVVLDGRARIVGSQEEAQEGTDVRWVLENAGDYQEIQKAMEVHHASPDESHEKNR